MRCPRSRTLGLLGVLAALTLAATACEPAGDAPAGDPPDEEEAPADQPETGPPEEAETTPEADEAPDEPAADGTADGTEEADAPVAVEPSVVASGLEAPWDIAFTPDERVFVTERDAGVVRELRNDGTAQVVASFDVNPTGEGGLLGLTVSPDHTEDGLLYAYHTTGEDNRVVRFAPGGEPEDIVTGIPRDGVHNGGRIAFGPDGQLYVATGDAGDGALSQDPESLAGKILRFTPDGDVPDDNPEEGSPVYALGLRNVQGLTWDAEGRLYASEFGPDVDDEINLIEPGGNYGWPEVTGQAGVDGFVDPIVVHQPPDASWSGLALLLDGVIPQWEGDLFASALRGERLWRFELGDDGSVAGEGELLVGEFGRLRHVTQGPDGALWLLTSNRDGRGQPVDGDDRVLRLGPADG